MTRLICVLLTLLISLSGPAMGANSDFDHSLLAANTTGTSGKFTVGTYNEIRGTVAGMDAHHVGQQALMKQLVPGYDAATAPSILVPKVGHTIRGPTGIVSRSTSGLDNVRDVIARDIWELRRVYPDVPNPALQELIQMNKTLYPSSLTK